MSKNNWGWSVKIFILSICLSVVFSTISQSLFPTLPNILSVVVILFFIALSTIFDMIGVAIASTNKEKLKKDQFKDCWQTANKLCDNTEKVSSFCCDVVGDICGILSGAGGVSLVLNLDIKDANLYLLVTCLVSSLIAGLTIFAKAIMKKKAVQKAEQVLLTTCQFLNVVAKPRLIFAKIRQKISKNK